MPRLSGKGDHMLLLLSLAMSWIFGACVDSAFRSFSWFTESLDTVGFTGWFGPLLFSWYNYSRLWLSRNPKNSMKHFEISVLRHTRFAELRKTINPTTTFNRMNF